MENSPDTSKKEFVLSNISCPLNKTRDALTTSSFNNIPNETILELFGYLSVRDLCNVSLVCRLFKMIANDDEIWKSKIIKPIKLCSKSYTQIYIEWIQIKKFQYESVTFSNRSSMRRNAYVLDLYPSFPIRPEGKHNFVCIHGFDQHPNSTQEMTINLSVDIDKNVRQLTSLVGKASYSQQKWQHSHILKQMIQRYYRFMQLKASHSSNLFLVPTLDIEIVWQTHLLRPEIYHNDCLRLFHRVIDHSLIIGHIQQFYKKQAFLDTCQLYEQKFGEKYYSFASVDEENEIKSKSSLNRYELLHHNDQMYSYWDKMFYEFSSNLSNNYENPFSFTENDIISDGKRFSFYDEFMYNAIEKVSSQSNISPNLTALDLRPEPMKLLKKSYERFLYMAAKYPLKDGNGFLLHTYAIDFIWQSHLQEPLNYVSDCIRLVGYIIFHDPLPILEADSSDQIYQIWKNEFQCDIDTDHLYSTSNN